MAGSTESILHVYGRGCALEDSKRSDHRRRHAVVRLIDLEVLQGALSLRSPVSVRRHLDPAEGICFGPCRLFPSASLAKYLMVRRTEEGPTGRCSVPCSRVVSCSYCLAIDVRERAEVFETTLPNTGVFLMTRKSIEKALCFPRPPEMGIERHEQSYDYINGMSPRTVLQSCFDTLQSV